MKIEAQYINNTKVANLIRRMKGLSVGTSSVNVGERGRDISVYLSISNELSCFDCAVADAVYTLFENDYREFSTRQVMQVLSGDMSQTLTKDRGMRISESIERLRNTTIEIDSTEEMQARRKISEGEKHVFSGAFLDVHYLSSLKFTKKYFLGSLAGMPLYQYAKAIRQIIKLRPEQLDFCVDGKRLFANSDENILIKRYIAQRWAVMDHYNFKSMQTISYFWEDSAENAARGMLNDLAIIQDFQESEDSQEPKEYLSLFKSKLRHTHAVVTKILDYYKENNYIGDYEVKKGPRGEVRGIEIIGIASDANED